MSYGIAKGSRAAVWLVAFLLTLLTITVHVVSPSTWRFSDQRWEEILRLRQESPIFGVRPITAICVKVISGVTGLSVKSAFFTLQFLLYFLTGPAFYYYLRRLRFDNRYALGGMIVFLSSLPLFMAHFEPIFTWSDFWIYLLVPLSFAPACERRYGLSVACMAIANHGESPGNYLLWQVRQIWLRALPPGIRRNVELVLCGSWQVAHST